MYQLPNYKECAKLLGEIESQTLCIFLPLMESSYEADHGFATDDDALGRGDETEGELVPVFDGEEDTFDVVELEILACQRREWTQARKKEKPAVLGEICRELGKLEKYCELGPAKWHEKRQEITRWLKKPLRTRKPRVTIRSRYKYPVHVVICELYHDQIQQKHANMKQEEGSHADTKRIDLYQQALTAFMEDDLTEEQLQVARNIADKWNSEAEMQLEEMWRYCGMRMVFMAGWKDEKGVVQACCMDHNSEISGRSAFDDLHTLNPSWREYLGKSFEDADVAEDEDTVTKGKQSTRVKKSDPVKLVTNEKGRACGRMSTSVPFKKLGQYQQDMIAAHHLPANFTFNVDPSHLHSATAAELLNFWQEWQVTHPNDIFAFQKQLDQSGNLQPPLDHNTRPLIIARDRKKRPQTSASGNGESSQEEAEPSTETSYSRAVACISQKKATVQQRCQVPTTDDELDGDLTAIVGEGERLPQIKVQTNITRKKGTRANASRQNEGSHAHRNAHKNGNHESHLAFTDAEGGDNSGDLADEDNFTNQDLPAISKSSTSRDTIPHKHGKWYTAHLQDALEDEDNDDSDSVPFMDERETICQPSRQNGQPAIFKPALKQSAGMNHSRGQEGLDAVDADIGDVDSNDPGRSGYSSNKVGEEGQPWKSPCICKTPLPPDANVPSLPPKASWRNKIVNGRKVKKTKRNPWLAYSCSIRSLHASTPKADPPAISIRDDIIAKSAISTYEKREWEVHMDDSAIAAIQIECIFTILPSKNMEISHAFVLQHPAISLVDILPIENQEESGGSLPQVESSSVRRQATPGKHNSMEALQAYGEESPSPPCEEDIMGDAYARLQSAEVPSPPLETEFDIQSDLFEQMKNARVPRPPSPTQTPDNQADIDQEPYSELFKRMRLAVVPRPPTPNVSPDENEDSQSDTFKRLQAARVPSPPGESTMDVSEQMENVISQPPASGSDSDLFKQMRTTPVPPAPSPDLSVDDEDDYESDRFRRLWAARVPSPPEFEDMEVSEAMEGVRLPSPSPPLDSDLFEQMRIVVVPPAPTPLELEGREEIHADFGWPIDFGDPERGDI
ncbi:hypothetical protein EDD17DRAFT_1502818 [Pisolithus thermaeus]|nr:hypothetical protein EDD17DRAFT_1502818 [Pisolithus thermaeus]